MQSDDSLAEEYIRTEKAKKWGSPHAAKYLERLKRRIRRRRRNELRPQIHSALSQA